MQSKPWHLPVGVLVTIVVTMGIAFLSMGRYQEKVDASCIALLKQGKRIEKVEDKAECNKDAVEKLAANIDKYIAVQTLWNEQVKEMVTELKESNGSD